MPNHVTNRLSLSGDAEQIKNLIATIKNDEIGFGSVDFNKIIPMPDHIFRGDLGTKEREQYGKNNWYDWSYDNWGTKWNAYHALGQTSDDVLPYKSAEDYQKAYGNILEFQTAWSNVHRVIEKLSEKFPDIQISYAWADEDTGTNVGKTVYENGKELDIDIPPDQSKEAYEMAFEILGDEPEDLCLRYDEDIGNYVYDENLDMELQAPFLIQGLERNMIKPIFTNTQEEQAYERMMQEVPRFKQIICRSSFDFCEDAEDEGREYGQFHLMGRW